MSGISKESNQGHGLPILRMDDLVPSLRQAFEAPPPDLTKVILVAVPVKNPQEHTSPVPAGFPRSELGLTDGKSFWHWETDSLQALFRGDKQPPELGDVPEAYVDSLGLLELHALELSKVFGDRRDAEMRELYSTLRRRPDGRSLGFVHDYMWQAAALLLATRPLSEAEFEAILARLERSCRTFEMGPTSRNYIAALRMSFGE